MEMERSTIFLGGAHVPYQCKGALAADSALAVPGKASISLPAYLHAKLIGVKSSAAPRCWWYSSSGGVREAAQGLGFADGGSSILSCTRSGVCGSLSEHSELLKVWVLQIAVWIF